ncbi:hypothetical protein [Rhizobium sp. BK602]|uniref:hypothetical protein n=1 Tax=Rhizobium sp. BK602 TaxID=2586986 RepID=UPI0016192537|nr:hypothetical protein [Rhizobium sp. BK602]MBB3608901.1 hypothetical protein [Rhizobium sp. BK602]
MSHVSSISNSSYAYRGTLSRLDANGDGILSREEREADERPGIIEADAGESESSTYGTVSSIGNSGALGSLMAKLIQLPSSGVATVEGTSDVNGTADLDELTAADAYNSTYGQYDVDDMAA